MKMKRIFAMALAMVMAMGTFAHAEVKVNVPSEGSSSGTGTVEGVVKRDVFHVILPVNNTSFIFKLDPENVMYQVGRDSAAVNNYNVEKDATVLFKRAPAKLSSKSDGYKVTNKSAVPINLSVNAEMSKLQDVLVSNYSVYNDTSVAGKAALYMALQGIMHYSQYTIDPDAALVPSYIVNNDTLATYVLYANEKDTTNLISEGKYYGNSGDTTMTKTLAGVPSYYYVTTDDAGKYIYKLMEDTAHQSGFTSYTFNLHGTCNSDADWSAVGLYDVSADVKLTWSVETYRDPANPSVANTSITATAGQDLVIPVDLGVGNLKANSLDKVLWVDGGNYDLKTGAATFVDGNLTIPGSSVNGAMQLKLVFDNGFEIVLNITV